MMKDYIYYILFLLLLFSCKSKHSGSLGETPVICLDPNEENILKVSDYFNRVEAVLLQDTFFFGVEDFIECPDKYIVLASDHPGLIQGKERYYVFDKKGYFRNCIGTLGRGAGEYQSILNGLQMGEDSLLKIIDVNKYLSYSLDGKVHQEKALLANGKKKPTLSSPIYLWKDSLVIFESILIITSNPELLADANRDSTPICAVYSLNMNDFIHSYFPKREVAEFYVNNIPYLYQDTFCYYYDKDRTIYQILPGEKKIRYRIDMGKYAQLQTMVDFNKEQESGVLRSHISLNLCNETAKYVLGMYSFKAKDYIFIYNKQTGKTENFRWVNNDLFKNSVRDQAFYFNWKKKLEFRQNYLWSSHSYDWIEMIDQVKSRLSVDEWKAYCEEHPDFIRIYDTLLKDKKNKDSEDYQGEDDDEKVVILKYYFK